MEILFNYLLNKLSKLNNTKPKMESSMDELNGGIKRTEETISKLEGRTIEITQTE